PGLTDFSSPFNANTGLILSLTRVPPTFMLLRDPSSVTAPAFTTTPVYPIAPALTSSVNGFAPNIQVPSADSFTVGLQRALNRDTSVEIRYVGTRAHDAWVTQNYNEFDIFENGFLNEFRKAQANLQANIAAGRGNTFAYTGAPGTSPLPIILAYFNGVASGQAADPAKYTSTSFTDSTFINSLATFNPQPCCSTNATTPSFAYNLINSAARRANAIAAGLPSNFLVANPDVLGSANNLGANFYTNGGGRRYQSAQFEYRQRLHGGAQIGVNYVFGRAYQNNRYGFRQDDAEVLQSGTVGGVAHALKGNGVFDLPFGREHRWANNLGPVMDRIVGGWQIIGVGRIQTGELLDLGNVRIVGMTVDELRDALAL